jgi:hypothetical protein
MTRVTFPHPAPPARWPFSTRPQFRASNNGPLLIGYRDPRLADFLASPSPTHSPSSLNTRGTAQTNHPSTSSHVLTSPAFPISNEAFCSPRPCHRVGSLRSARSHRRSNVHLQALLSVSLVTAGRFGGSQPMQCQARPALTHALRAPGPAKSCCRPPPSLHAVDTLAPSSPAEHLTALSRLSRGVPSNQCLNRRFVRLLRHLKILTWLFCHVIGWSTQQRCQSRTLD